MTTTETRTYKAGDRVCPDPAVDGHALGVIGRTFVVDRKGPVNLILRAEDGGRGYRCPASMLLPAPTPGEAAPVARPFRERVFFTLGEVVTVKNGRGKISPGDPYVVFKHDGGDKVNIVKLGGESDRYWRWPASDLVKRDLAWLTERLVEMA